MKIWVSNGEEFGNGEDFVFTKKKCATLDIHGDEASFVLGNVREGLEVYDNCLEEHVQQTLVVRDGRCLIRTTYNLPDYWTEITPEQARDLISKDLEKDEAADLASEMGL